MRVSSGPTLGLGLVLGMIASAAAVDGAEAPASSYPHKTVKRQEFGCGAQSYWLFEPAEPTPPAAPVVVLLHGWYAYNPAAYGAWIEHLARSGQTVIFPR